MPQSPVDLVKVFRVLAEHNVDYVLIGGQAAALHGSTVPTRDSDILTRDAPDNLERLAGALNELNASSDLASSASVEELWGMNTRWDTSAGQIDVLVTARGPDGTTVNWSNIHERAERVSSRGVTVIVAGLDDLIRMKLAAGRPHDLEVVKELRAHQAGTTPPHRAPPEHDD